MNESAERKAAFVRYVTTAYPGLRRFVTLSRNLSTGETLIHFYDLDAAPLDPVYSVSIHPRDVLICTTPMVLPSFSYTEFLELLNTGTPPAGYVSARSYPSPEGLG